MWATIRTKAQKQLYMKFVCKFFLDSPIPACQANRYRLFTNWLSLLESVNLRKICSKRHVKLLLWPKLPTYFDDVATIENNRQVLVNIDATLVAIFRNQSTSNLVLPLILVYLFVKSDSNSKCTEEHGNSSHLQLQPPFGDRHWGAAVADWVSSWLAEQGDRGSIPGLATWIFRDWLSPASKSRYGWRSLNRR